MGKDAGGGVEVDHVRFDGERALHEALANLLGRNVDLIMSRAMRKKHFLLPIDEPRELLIAA